LTAKGFDGSLSVVYREICAYGDPPRHRVSGSSPVLAGLGFSEIELQCKLNEPWIVRRLREAEGALEFGLPFEHPVCAAVSSTPVLGSDI